MTPTVILFASAFLTAVHATQLVDFGFSSDSWYNFYAWQFVHRTYAHGVANYALIALLIGSRASLSLRDITMISGFVAALSTFDNVPFYGASGLLFCLFGKIMRRELLLDSYDLPGTALKIPYLLPALVILWQVGAAETLTTSIDALHLFAFLCGATLPSSLHQGRSLTMMKKPQTT